MRILLKKYNGEEYVWKDATYGYYGNFYIDRRLVYETDIVAVKNNNHSKYIICDQCGQIFKLNSEEWAKHKSPVRSTEQCFTCGSLSVSGSNASCRTTYTLQKDGLYKRTITESVMLKCNQCYAEIGTETAQNNCIYNACVNAETRTISNIFTKYGDDVFKDLITIDRILEYGCSDVQISNNGICCRLKSKYNITAYINELNIVTRFHISCKGYNWNVMYSKKLNKLFVVGYGHYTELNLGQYPDIAENTHKAILKLIASLYE